MTIRICAVLCFAAAISVTMAAQDEPVLVSANIPKHPPLACQARIEGLVKLSFTLAANAAEPTNVEVVSGHAMLKGAAVENVNTWRFQNPYAVERKSKQRLIIGFPRPARKRSPLNRSTAWKLPLACRSSGNPDYRKIGVILVDPDRPILNECLITTIMVGRRATPLALL
jgi:hypothetical protein